MMPCLQARAWSRDEFWPAVDAVADYASKMIVNVDKESVRERVLENILFFSRPMGNA